MNAYISRFSPCSVTNLFRTWWLATMVILSSIAVTTQIYAQTTVELTSVADAEIYADAATTNYGACNEMYVGFFSDKKRNYTDRAVVRFDLTTLPANITIQSATLRLTSVARTVGDTTPESTSRNVAIHQIAANQIWTEGTGSCAGGSGNVTWTNRTTGTPWSIAGGGPLGTALATTSVGGLGQHTWTSTALRDAAAGWYSTPANNNGLVIKYASETTDGYKLFASRQATADANKPKLIVTYTFNCATVIGGATVVCVGSSDTVTATPSAGGTWTSLNTAVATVTSGGVVTGVYPGTATLRFTQGSCTYDRVITVNPRPVVAGGNLGTGTGNVNFQYYSSAPSGNTVDNIPTFGASSTGTIANFTASASTPFSARFLGFIRIDTAGSYTFYTNSDDGSKLFINNQLVVSNDGEHAAQEVSGSITLSPGWYPIKVEYFNSIGSGSLATSYQGPAIVKQAIPGSILSTSVPTQTLNLCVGGTANVTPSAGGTWVSSNPAVASVSNAGVVSGLTAGTTTLTFTNAEGCTGSISATIVAGPSLSGASSVCVGQTTNVLPGTGGTWVSSNPAIASVTNAGLVTGQSAGSVTLTFTNSSTGCVSSTGFSVTARPTLGGASAVCVGNTATVTPSTGGTWVSSNPAVATVNNSGTVTGQSAGTVTLTFTDGLTNCTNSRVMTVNGLVTLGGASSTCVGIPALVTPNTGGTWVSSNPAIATVDNSGNVTGISGGTVTLSFTNSATGCVSSKSFTVNVPIGQGGGQGIGGATSVCAGFQTNVTPASGGVWATSDSAIATVSNAGEVTGFSPGVVTFTFTENGSGCVSTVQFTVYPDVVAGGASSVCQGLSANVTPTSNGTWVSSDPTIAFVNNAGIVTGLQPGTVTLTFTSFGGCSDSKSFTVHPKPSALGAASVQVGQTANVTPATGGTWVSSNPAIATVTDQGVVSGLTEGSVTLTFTNTTTGCIGTKALAVIDPGFYKNESMTDSGDKTDPDPENNQDPEVVFPQSFTALVVTVFQDTDGDEDGDQPVPAVTITVRDAEGNTVAVVTTGLDGSFTFDDLPPGFYTVEQHVPNGNFTYTTNPYPVTVVLNEFVRADFINSQLGQISGTIFANNGDDVMPNVVVSLLDQNGDPVLDSNNQPIVTSTNDAGFYIFDRVPIGTYQVQQTVPSGFVAVDDVDGTDLTMNGDVTPIVIAPGTVIVNQNFTNFEPGKIVGNVSIDTDLNLAGDQPHTGVSVAVFRPGFGPDGIAGNGDDNTPIATTTTDSEGNFTFTDLDPGNYTVAQTVPANYTAVSDSDGGSFTTVGDITPIAIVEGSTGIANFLNQPQTDIAVDKSVNNSTPVAGSNVTFTVVVTNNGPQNATDVKVDDVALGFLYVSHIATKGSFALSPGAPENTFSGLWSVGALNVGESATLTVVATVTPNAVLATYTNAVNAYSELGDPNLTNNEDEVEVDPVFGSISGNVSRDTNGDNEGNTPVAGITLSLVDISGNPVLGSNNLALIAITDGSGNYSFTDLPPGSYRVVETVPAGDVAVNDVDGGNLAINGDTTPITLTGGQTVANQDFVIAALGSISGTIRQDVTGDSQGDVPLPGVVVVLLQTNGSPVLDENNDPITTVTDEFGNYSFPVITPGDYRVAHVPPGGMIAVDDMDGGNLTINGDQTAISVLPGADVTGQDFVDAALVSLSGSVLADADDDGDGDTGISGVTITLVNASNVTIATTTTNNLGQYSFANIPAGSYRIVETQPTGYTSVSDADGGNLDIIGDLSAIVLLPGANLTGQDFVEILNATITGIVQADTNNDNNGDAPLGGVTITLLDENDLPVATTTTNPDGSYSFPNVLPGDYTVVQTDLTGYVSLTPNEVAVSLPPGGSAFVPYVDEQLGTITGIVDADTTGNGTGDTPLSNVTVTLKDENGNDIDSDPNTPGVQPTTTTTAPDGSYSFEDVPPGNYTVVETDLPGYISLTPNSVPVSLPSGGTETANFTDTELGSISGVVDADTTGDNNGDTPLANVTVTLKDGNGNDIDSDPNTPGVQPTTTTTGVDGSYNFPNLPPGDYTVVQTDLPNYISLTPNTVEVTLTPGEDETVDYTDAQFASITGNVFNDLNRLTDNTVNGTGTNAGGLFINLVNPTGNLVIASIPVNADGTFTLTQANGVNINSNYLLVLTPTVRTVGTVLTASSLPSPWISTGENLGTGIGSDGTVNGILAVSTTVGGLSNANFGIVIPPDVTPIITAQPNVMTGTTDFNIRIQVTELNQVDTQGTIVVRVPKDNRWVLREAYDSNLTILDGVTMNNNNWTYTENATHHIFTTVNPSIFIPGGNFSYFGIKARWSTVAQVGVYTITSQIDSGSGNETRIDNNSDAEKIDFFNN